MARLSGLQPVSDRAWSELLHAEVGTRLGRAGIPCLHIKGPTVATWLYEPGERAWGDVDILLPPSRMDDALGVLLSSGFSYRDPGLRWRTSEDHALTLWHDPKGVATHQSAAEVDVHHRFQGMDSDPERAFEELWRRREPARLAELDVWYPDLTSRALLLVLNAARDPLGAKAREDLRRLLASTTDDEWERLIALAGRVEALEALRAGLEQHDAGRELVGRTALAEVSVSTPVRLRALGSSRTSVRIEELRAAGPFAKLRMLAGWVVPAPSVIRMRDPWAAGSVWRMARAYAVRYRQGARELRLSVREIRDVRRQTPAPAPVAVREPGIDTPVGRVPDPPRPAEPPGVVEAVAGGYRRPSYVGACQDREQVVLLDLRSGERHILSPTGAAIWRSLMATGSLPAAVAQLQEDFPDAPGLAEDTERFVADLEAQGVVER